MKITSDSTVSLKELEQKLLEACLTSTRLSRLLSAGEVDEATALSRELQRKLSELDSEMFDFRLQHRDILASGPPNHVTIHAETPPENLEKIYISTSPDDLQCLKRAREAYKHLYTFDIITWLDPKKARDYGIGGPPLYVYGTTKSIKKSSLLFGA